jgi:hypothetical protein
MVTVIVSTILTIFAWPVATATPKDIPLGVQSPFDGVTAELQTQFDAQQPGTFKLVEYKTMEAAQAGIAQREVYGVIVVDQNPKMLVASGASPVMAQLLNNLANQLGQQLTAGSGGQAVVFQLEDLAPLGDKDARGLGLSAGSLPLVIAGIVVGILGTMRLRKIGQKFAVAGIAAVLAASSMVAILNLWLGSLQGNYFIEVAVVALGIAAVSLTIMGLAGLIGRAGMLAGIGLFFIIGNPLSGVALPTEFYPAGLGTFGQYLPLGAEVNLLRRISYFPEASTTTQWLTMLAWLGVGALLVLLSRNKKQATPSN